MFRILYLYHLALLNFLFGFKFKDRALKASIQTFFDHQTFRFPKKVTTDYFIVLKIVKRIVLSQFKRQNVFETNEVNGVAIFDADLTATVLRIPYVERQDSVKVKIVIAREGLLQYINFLYSLFILIFLFVVTPAVFVISVFCHNKLSIALWILNLVEAINLNKILKTYKIDNLYFFNCHENDANLLAYALMQNNIYINKIPSEVPLQFWNKVLVANSLNICFRYQQDEYDFFKSTMFVDTLKYWIPENGLEIEQLYIGKEYPVNKNVGFYSSGMWLRSHKGRIDLKDDSVTNEIRLFNLLDKFVCLNPEYKLLVFLHPIEKAENDLTLKYYAQFKSNIKFADISKKNNNQFYNADVAVTLYSTLSYERIFWGYKTLIYPLGHLDFPLSLSNFNKVIIKNDSDLNEKLLKALNQTGTEFFKEKEMNDYIYSNYNIFKT